MASDLPLLLPLDMNGQPYFQEASDARDIAQGLRLMLYRTEANDEAFNLTPPTIVNMAEFIPYMAKATGRRYVEARLPFGVPRIHASGAKARALLGYNPQYSLFDMVDEATGKQK
jgi:UDP-glucose 4-epimerase